MSYLRELEEAASYDQLVVLIPEVQPARAWQWILHNQRGFVLERAIQHGTTNVVICRLRYRLAAVAQGGASAPDGGSAPDSSAGHDGSSAELKPPPISSQLDQRLAVTWRVKAGSRRYASSGSG